MKIISKFAIFFLLMITVTTMTINEVSASLMPDWTQKNNFACLPSQYATESVDAFLWGLRK